MPKLFALVFTEDLPWDRKNATAACWCKDWRSVRRMLAYYGPEAVKVFKVRGQRPTTFAHDLRKPTKAEIEAHRAAHPDLQEKRQGV